MESNTLGRRLAERLQELHMTQKELSIQAEVTEAAVSHYIKGDRYPRASVLARLADSLGTTSDYLLGVDSQIRPPATSDYIGGDNLQYSRDDLEYATKLIARNASVMTSEQKDEILRILMEEQ